MLEESADNDSGSEYILDLRGSNVGNKVPVIFFLAVLDISANESDCLMDDSEQITRVCIGGLPDSRI